MKEKIKCQPRVITVDRNPAKIWAIKEVFPSSNIVYCMFHIRRDLLKYFNKYELILYFDLIMYNKNYCDFYVQKLQERLTLMKGNKGEEK